MREALMMGLRLSYGISHERWTEKFGSPLADFMSAEKIARLRREGYIANDAHALRATKAGMQRLNGVIQYLID